VIPLAEYIAENYRGRVVEIGVGNLFAVSDALERMGFDVLRVDIRKTRHDVIVDDACRPNHRIYEGACLIFSIRPPIDIQKCIIEIGMEIGCDVIIVPLKIEVIDGGKLKNYMGIPLYIFTPRSRKDLQDGVRTL